MLGRGRIVTEVLNSSPPDSAPLKIKATAHSPHLIPVLSTCLAFSRSQLYTSGSGLLLKHSSLGLTIRVSDSVGLWWVLRICISNTFSGDTDAIDLGKTFQEPLLDNSH